MGEEAFAAWGWRVPFLLSIVLLAISLWIRLQLAESPVFQRMKEEGTTSKAPLKEAFGNWRNLRMILIALLGAAAGQGVIRSEEHTSELQSLMRISYAVFCLKKKHKLDMLI